MSKTDLIAIDRRDDNKEKNITPFITYKNYSLKHNLTALWVMCFLLIFLNLFEALADPLNPLHLYKLLMIVITFAVFLACKIQKPKKETTVIFRIDDNQTKRHK